MDRYAEIAAELRGMIERGELGPGDRVPSTREITRRWHVAMATATRVLAELRDRGLVRAVPGVGTVVADAAAPARTARPSPAGGRPPLRRPSGESGLTTDRIVAAALRVVDAEGLEALSMRRVAAELGVATMSLYRHVPDKDGLVHLMTDAAFAGTGFTDEQAALGWRERLELAARLMWRLFRARPWLAPALSLTRPQPLANALPFGEWMLSTLVREGLDGPTAFTAYLTLFNYVRGTALNLETEAAAEAATGQDAAEWMELQEPRLLDLIAGRFPTFERLARKGYDFDLDELMEFGLQRLLDGLAVEIGAARAGRR